MSLVFLGVASYRQASILELAIGDLLPDGEVDIVEYEGGERELYDLSEDPYELDNVYERAGLDLIRRAEEWLEALRGCAGATCRTAEDGY